MAAAIQQRQRDELHRRIWQIANDVRGAVDGWDFKQYVLGALFYRFISENFVNYMENGDESINYAKSSDNIITPAIKAEAVKVKVTSFIQASYLKMSSQQPTLIRI